MTVNADMELPAGTTDSEAPVLAANALSMRTVLLFGAVGLGLFPTLLSGAGPAVHAGGMSTWLAELIGVAGIALVAVPIVAFARRHTVTGSVMSLLGEEFGSRWRAIPGAALLGGYVCALVAFGAGAVLSAGSFFNDIGIHVADDLAFQLPVLVLSLLFTSWLTARGVKASVKTAIAMGLALAPFALLIVIASSIKGGVHLADQFQLEGFESTGFVHGILYAVAIFCGFEGLTALGRETQNARQAMPRVLMTLIPLFGGVLVIGALLQVPLLLANIDQLSAGASPAAVLADVGGVGWAKAPTDFLSAVAGYAAIIGYQSDAARVAATMGRDGGLPGWIGRVDGRRHTPARAAWTIGLLTVAIFAAYVSTSTVGMLLVLTNFAELTSYMWLIAYAVVCVGGLVYGTRTATRSNGVTAASALGLLFVGGCYLWPMLHEASGFVAASPYLALGWTAVVATLAARSERRRARAGRSPEVAIAAA